MTVWDFSAIILSFQFFVLVFLITSVCLFVLFFNGKCCCCQVGVFFRIWLESAPLCIFFSFLGELRLSLYRNLLKTHWRKQRLYLFLGSLQILERGREKLVLNRLAIQVNLQSTEKKVNRCKLNEYENCEKSYAWCFVFFFSICLLFSFCSFAFLVLEAPPPPFCFVVVVGVPWSPFLLSL